MPKQTLDALFDLTLRLRCEVPADPDSTLAWLHLAGCRRPEKSGQPVRSNVLLGLAVGGGPEIGAAARLMVLRLDPEAAVLELPSWSASVSREEMDRLGAQRVSQLPPELRRDVMVLWGEDRAGARRTAHLTYAAGRWTQDDRWRVMESRFEDLFLADRLLQEAIEKKMVPRGMSPFTLRERLRATLERKLGEGVRLGTQEITEDDIEAAGPEYERLRDRHKREAPRHPTDRKFDQK